MCQTDDELLAGAERTGSWTGTGPMCYCRYGSRRARSFPGRCRTHSRCALRSRHSWRAPVMGIRDSAAAALLERTISASWKLPLAWRPGPLLGRLGSSAIRGRRQGPETDAASRSERAIGVGGGGQAEASELQVKWRRGRADLASRGTVEVPDSAHGGSARRRPARRCRAGRRTVLPAGDGLSCVVLRLCFPAQPVSIWVRWR